MPAHKIENLTVLIPGLLWPDPHTGAEVCQGIELSALSTLLAKGKINRFSLSLNTLMAWPWSGAFTGWAGYLGQQQQPTIPASHWLIASPICLQAERDQALVLPSYSLSDNDYVALTLALNTYFAADGLRFYELNERHWLLASSLPVQATFSPLSDVLGESLQMHLPQGEKALYWHRVLNEMQMFLHQQTEVNHPFSVNGLWLWGEGDHFAWQPPNGLVMTNQPLMRWVLEQKGGRCTLLPQDAQTFLASSSEKSPILVLDQALLAAQQRDTWAWRGALEQMDQNWLAPLLQAVEQKAIKHLTLLVPGDPGVRLHVNSWAKWKWWCKPISMKSLYAPY